MRLFSISEAEYYTSSFGGSGGVSQRSLTAFCKACILPNRIRTLSEGTTIFDQYRDCLLRDVERSLFVSASHYRRALDLMTCSAAPWAHVTLYYGNWHVAHALLGLFGCAVVSDRVIDVCKGRPGGQVLRIRGIGTKPGQAYTTYRGSHRRFWDLFYQAFQGARATFPSGFWSVLTPISGDPLWQIARRNDINYDLHSSIQLAQDFDLRFACGAFPACLPSVMNTQYKVFELLLEMSFYYAQGFGIATDALDGIRGHSPLRAKIRELIYNEKASGLVRRTRKAVVT